MELKRDLKIEPIYGVFDQEGFDEQGRPKVTHWFNKESKYGVAYALNPDGSIEISRFKPGEETDMRVVSSDHAKEGGLSDLLQPIWPTSEDS